MNAPLPPYPDVETVVEETEAREANKLLKDGWLLLLTVAAADTGGQYVVYIMGKPRPKPPVPTHIP